MVLYLHARDLLPAEPGAKVVWHRPRFEAAGKAPMLLSDYSKFRHEHEVDYSSIFANTSKYLNAVAEKVRNPNANLDALASTHNIDRDFLHRWFDLLAVDVENIGRIVPLVPLQPLDEKLEKANSKAGINGWKKKGQELPVLVTNSSDTEEHIPGRSSPHSVVVHPMPQEFVAVAWKSPVAGKVQVSARITSAHPACGNGVAWWLEHRHAEKAVMFAEGAIGVGGEAKPTGKQITVEKGDQIILAVDAKNGDHGCDLTDIALTITEANQPKSSWNLSADIADSIHAGNPHPDQFGHRDTWSFVYGPARSVKSKTTVLIPPGSLLDLWRLAVNDAKQQNKVAGLTEAVQQLLAGPRAFKDKDPNSLLYDNLAALDGPLFQGTVPVRLSKPTTTKYGLDKNRFSSEADLVADADSTIEVHLPAALFQGREFRSRRQNGEAKQLQGSAVSGTHCTTLTKQNLGCQNDTGRLKHGSGYASLLKSTAEFRRLFPLYLCFPGVIPNDEVVSLKMFHREDVPLIDLFLNPEQARLLDQWWSEHQFISKEAVAEHAYLPQFIGFVSQDGAPGHAGILPGPVTSL